ncbi:MAG: lysophospholipid acyltransferase family protein [Bryobacteraceae bacterium]|nr:lysophospholipid acyltransferase family protein [Bryobacteraceae bacterium]
MARQRSAFRNRVEYAFVRVLLAVLGALPYGKATALARFCLRAFDSRFRPVAEANLAMALPATTASEREAIIEGCFRSLARLLALIPRFPSIGKSNVHDWIRYEGFEHFENAKRQGRGVLFATAHLGNWEFSAFAHALMAEPMTFVVRPLDNPLLDELATRYRTLSGNRVLSRTGYARAMLAVLKRNEALGILIDQNVTADRGVFIDFFGVKACVDSGFARLAAHSKAAVIPGYALWSESEQKFVLHFDPPVPISGEALADTQAIHTALENAIRRHPGQWLWIHRRWKTRPPEESAGAG